MSKDVFLFKDYAFDETSGVLSLTYGYSDGTEFIEKIIFPPLNKKLSPPLSTALDRAFRLIFLLAGISYYKAFVPPKIDCRAFKLSATLSSFLEKTYQHGLGEFAFQNNLDLTDRLTFPIKAAQDDAPLSLDLSSHELLVPVGGGKDSIVTIEALKNAGYKPTLFAVGSADGVADPILKTIEKAGLSSLIVQRILSPALFALNKEGALNGHVPVTAIISSIAVATALMHNQSAVILSNEHSADAPNLRFGDKDINHQYSKSLAFEKDFSTLISDYISPDLSYFSFLRPLSEAEITRRFALLSDYHAIFRSCNAAFRQVKNDRASQWCNDCPKCRFVFLALAPFLSKEIMVAIFGKNLLDDPSQLDGFRALCGLSSHKPFECVGEVEESLLLMQSLSKSAQWRDDTIVQQIILSKPLDERVFENHFNALFSTRYPHRLPLLFLAALDVKRN